MNTSSSIKNHYAWLDLIRFFAAVIVLICHYRGAFLQKTKITKSLRKVTKLFFIDAKFNVPNI